MVRAVAQLDMDETGHWDYHGHSSGLSFVRRLREQLGDLMGPDTMATPFVKSRPMSQIQDSPRSIQSPFGGEALSTTGLDLPPKDMARKICSYAVNDAAVLLRTVHQPTFWASFEQLYGKAQENYNNADNTFLPLFYSVIALGCLYGKDDDASLIDEGYESAIQQGFTYFKTARQLLDIADCRDLSSIQAVVFMILFLQSSSKMSQCYAYVGVALRSALRMGLHRAATGKFDPIEAESRKRVFWIVRKMDIYVGAMLGLPQTLSDDDIDQEFPTEVDDEYITRDGILPMPEGVVSLMTAFNCHTRMVNILQKIMRKIYPINVSSSQTLGDKSYSVPFSTIREIESELEEWKQSLPPILTPCEAPERYLRIQQLLRLSYAHAQVLLYRPFLHFTAMEKRSRPVDQRAYACAASFVNVSRNIIHIASQMKQKGLLNGAFWFIMYTTFFSILALVYFAAENPDNPTTEAVMKDAIEGKEVLASLASRSMAADRCTVTLNIIFQRLPSWMRDGQQNPSMTSKKRPYDAGPEASRSHPDVSVASQEPPQVGIRRASTFPRHENTSSPSLDSPMDNSWSQSASSYGTHTPTSAPFDASTFSAANQRNFSQATSGAAQSYGLPPNFANPGLTDLSSIMFPAGDEPFVYPNQPLTTFENNQQFAKGSMYPSAQAFTPLGNASPAASSSRGREENIEAQFFPLPPYIEQRQQQQMPQLRTQSQTRGFGMGYQQQSMPFNTGGQSTGAMPAMQMSNGGNWAGQSAFPQGMIDQNINIQDLFGGQEWNPMFAGYQQQQNQ
jgi:hypothetical protein